MRLKLGVLGAGHFGRFHVLKAAAGPRVELVGLHDHDPERAATVAGEVGVPALPAAEAIGPPTASTPTNGAPNSAKARSMSCTIRSSTTGTSSERGRKGAIRTASM